VGRFGYQAIGARYKTGPNNQLTVRFMARHSQRYSTC